MVFLDESHLVLFKYSGLIHSVITADGNVHDLFPAAELLHGDEAVVNGDAGYQGIAKRPEMTGKTTEFRVSIRPGKRRVLPDSQDGRRQDLIEAAKAHVRAKVDPPFRVNKEKFGFHKARLRGMAKNCCKVKVTEALTKLFLERRLLLALISTKAWFARES